MNLKLREVSITFIVEDFNPNILNFDILSLTKVIPEHWQLSIKPIQNNQEVIICFKNQVSIVVQTNKIILSEVVENNALDQIKVGKLALNLIKKFPEIDILGISVNPDYYYCLSSNKHPYGNFYERILGLQFWQQFNQEEIISAGIQLVYPYKMGQLILSIYQADIQVSQSIFRAICFTGNFDYRIFSTDQYSKYHHIQQILGDWDVDLRKFRKFITKKILESSPNSYVSSS